MDDHFCNCNLINNVNHHESMKIIRLNKFYVTEVLIDLIVVQLFLHYEQLRAAAILVKCSTKKLIYISNCRTNLMIFIKHEFICTYLFNFYIFKIQPKIQAFASASYYRINFKLSRKLSHKLLCIMFTFLPFHNFGA